MDLLISLLILALVVWLAFYIIDMLPLPEPPKMIVKIIIGVIVLIIIFQQFLPVASGGRFRLLG